MNDRRIEDPLDDTERLTKSEVQALKKIAGYYRAGQVVLVVVVGLGALAMWGVDFYDKIAHFFKN